jgi:hypothetical protein
MTTAVVILSVLALGAMIVNVVLLVKWMREKGEAELLRCKAWELEWTIKRILEGRAIEGMTLEEKRAELQSVLDHWSDVGDSIDTAPKQLPGNGPTDKRSGLDDTAPDTVLPGVPVGRDPDLRG